MALSESGWRGRSVHAGAEPTGAATANIGYRGRARATGLTGRRCRFAGLIAIFVTGFGYSHLYARHALITADQTLFQPPTPAQNQNPNQNQRHDADVRSCRYHPAVALARLLVRAWQTATVAGCPPDNANGRGATGKGRRSA